ncbi:MAG: hypothetical protein COT73_10695 [Bdellovibrio sp. CG10_big_fil_rev_8_21_14_0_10_47_8]|nr:MAG: hypothetical protein COT73_10695 [Bdellovibrio sp. CG10_big_fil_rev_8_21_14_0_10_47_8]
MDLYVYTAKAFDPTKPSYIYVDGGPGQNTHGQMPEILDGQYNELRFDQRGLGCSAPNSYDTYKDPSLYSTENTIRDMELIRKSYGIKSWAVYGVSYGTVPATMYGSKYPRATKSVVLEGVFGNPNMIHRLSYKAEKLNFALEKLNEAQRDSFGTLMRKDSVDNSTIVLLAFELFYYNSGMTKLSTYLSRIIETDGTIRRDIIAKIRQLLQAKENKYPLPQQPGAVDENIMNIIYCKNLSYRNRPNEVLYYGQARGFYTEVADNSRRAAECDAVGVQESDEIPFKMTDNVLTIPTYYFQGSHDGATMATGAIEHWTTVPQNESYFLLAQKGGHNPNLSSLSESDAKPAAQSAEKRLFRMGVSATPIDQKDVNQVNDEIGSQFWKLYLKLTPGIYDDLRGIQAVRPF